MKVEAVVKSGHGVASGKAHDARYPRGTLRAQYEHFQARGLDLSPFFTGTVNADIAPYSFSIGEPKYFFERVRWSSYIPPENFYFFDVSLQYDEKYYDGLIYMPDPTTKEDHPQEPTILELLLPKVNGLAYGHRVQIKVNAKQLLLIRSTAN